jgi:hypothetical protein
MPVVFLYSTLLLYCFHILLTTLFSERPQGTPIPCTLTLWDKNKVGKPEKQVYPLSATPDFELLYQTFPAEV